MLLVPTFIKTSRKTAFNTWAAAQGTGAGSITPGTGFYTAAGSPGANSGLKTLNFLLSGSDTTDDMFGSSWHSNGHVNNDPIGRSLRHAAPTASVYTDLRTGGNRIVVQLNFEQFNSATSPLASVNRNSYTSQAYSVSTIGAVHVLDLWYWDTALGAAYHAQPNSQVEATLFTSY